MPTCEPKKGHVCGNDSSFKLAQEEGIWEMEMRLARVPALSGQRPQTTPQCPLHHMTLIQSPSQGRHLWRAPFPPGSEFSHL